MTGKHEGDQEGLDEFPVSAYCSLLNLKKQVIIMFNNLVRQYKKDNQLYDGKRSGM